MEFPPSRKVDDSVFIRRCFRLPARETAHLRFLIEGYDGLLFLRSLDGRAALVEISYPPSCLDDAEGVIAALAAETGLEEVVPPPPALPL